MRVHYTVKSGNAKVGPLFVSTTESKSCPDSCPLKFTVHDDGTVTVGPCYAKSGPLALHWRKVDSGERGVSWSEFCTAVSAIPDGSLWRHNQAGDLPHSNGVIDFDMVSDLVQANHGKRGFTYTHHDVFMSDNLSALRQFNKSGFTVNVSANNAREADEYIDLGLPTVTLLPYDTSSKTVASPAGRTIVRCPAEYRDTSCAECGMCAIADRDFIIGFSAHGSSKRKADVIARG